MSNQPKPTDEISDFDSGPAYAELAAAIEQATNQERNRWQQFYHDAIRDKEQLAAAKSGGWLSREALDEYAKIEAEHRELQQQLAAAQAAIVKVCDWLCINEQGIQGANLLSVPENRAWVQRLLTGDTTALDAAIEQKRLEIWRDAPNQPDIQEAVIAKLDLVHRDAIAAAQQPLVDALTLCLSAIRHEPGSSEMRACIEGDAALAKVKEGK